MSEPDERALDGEPIDDDVGEADDVSYLRLVESVFCEEWLSAADAEAYDGLWKSADPTESAAVIPGLTRDLSQGSTAPQD